MFLVLFTPTILANGIKVFTQIILFITKLYYMYIMLIGGCKLNWMESRAGRVFNTGSSIEIY